jgi:uncharacterized lipoprotein YajG
MKRRPIVKLGLAPLAAILILAAGCSQSPTAPTATPADANLSAYATIKG